jgi:hypothetical protein
MAVGAGATAACNRDSGFAAVGSAFQQVRTEDTTSSDSEEENGNSSRAATSQVAGKLQSRVQFISVPYQGSSATSQSSSGSSRGVAHTNAGPHGLRHPTKHLHKLQAAGDSICLPHQGTSLSTSMKMNASALMTLGTGARSVGNGGSGYAAELGGVLMVGKDSSALSNAVDGFSVSAARSLLQVHQGCKAEYNKWDGFAAGDQGQLVGQGCLLSRGNQEHGFTVKGPGSQLVAGDNCTAEGNRGSGFAALGGGQLVAGQGCSAAHNHSIPEFNQDDESGSRLIVWPDSGTR